MSQFTAADGRKYTIEYDLPTVRDIRREISIDLLTADGIAKATSSVIDFAEVLWQTVRKQAERQGVDEGDFIRSIQSNLDDIADAWLKAVANFFESIGRTAHARLAESFVATERFDRTEANKLMDRSTAHKVAMAQTTANTNKRRKALEELLGKDDENEPSIPGATSAS